MASHITVTPIAEPVTVMAGEVTLGSSSRAIELKEGSYPPVVYVPREDIDQSKLDRTERASTCPWKGKASYYSIRTPGGVLDNAVWSYEAPLPDLVSIAGHLAFYTDRVQVRRG
jgi:uncharacterized protein (DUF427 family)